MPAGSRLAAHARSGPGRRLRHPRCAVSGPCSFLSLAGPRGRTAHKCYDCWCLAPGLLSGRRRRLGRRRRAPARCPSRRITSRCAWPASLCLHCGPAGVDVTPRRPVRASPGFDLAAARSPHGEPAQPAGGRGVTTGDVTSPPGVPPGPPAPCRRSQAAERGGACVYGGKPRSPQHGAACPRCGAVPTRRAGAPPAGLHLPILAITYSAPAAAGRRAEVARARVGGAPADARTADAVASASKPTRHGSVEAIAASKPRRRRSHDGIEATAPSRHDGVEATTARRGRMR